MDIMGPTPQYEAEYARRGSNMRFVQGDLHDEVALAGLGEHDVVWCSGVLYHAPHPLLTLERLRSVTGETLILATETLPERLPESLGDLPPAEFETLRDPQYVVITPSPSEEGTY